MNTPPADIITSIVLAAGASSRLGQSKQLLLVEGEPLLRRIARTSCESNADRTLVVLGDNEREHGRVIRDLPLYICIHSGWEKGMGSSLKAGMDFIQHFLADTTAILVLVCDQPLLTADHLNELIDKYRSTQAAIVASAYSGILGVPAIFGASLFDEIRGIGDQQGARQIIDKNKARAQQVEFPGGELDIDTPEDYQRYLDSLRAQEEARLAQGFNAGKP
ncbi:MAG: nucleotidyltransferase family protein [Cyclobacteriaceae bacterium]|jgi:molybdenum cofactor cytidylyltransferase|nr:nucleotidyltransferase family protein [Cyclobacteriaceae bacterium]